MVETATVCLFVCFCLRFPLHISYFLPLSFYIYWRPNFYAFTEWKFRLLLAIKDKCLYFLFLKGKWHSGNRQALVGHARQHVVLLYVLVFWTCSVQVLGSWFLVSVNIILFGWRTSGSWLYLHPWLHSPFVLLCQCQEKVYSLTVNL